MRNKKCDWCGRIYYPKRTTSRFCSQKCGAAQRWSLVPKDTDKPRRCRVCGSEFFATRDANRKQVCSDACRRARVAQITREWHKRNPDREAIYRQRTKEKQLPANNLARFRKSNPKAPTACESCGENRVLDIAHKPGHWRNGAWRSKRNCKWPEMVWVLCPTYHALIDRMHYPPEELGLKT